MRILVIGAGAVGGYFGGRLAASGSDVTFAVRPATAAVLEREGLRLRSELGDLHLPAPQLLSDGAGAPLDLVLLCTKLRALDAALGAAARHRPPAGSVAGLPHRAGAAG